MMDRARKTQLRHEVRDKQRKAARAAFPLPPNDLRAMFGTLDSQLVHMACDHTRRLTRKWLEEHGHDIAPVFAWLDANGGYCDCEVLLNAEQVFTEAMKSL
jgi:hypothetical protein